MWGPVIELVDLRYRPEVNTIEALAEPGPIEHAPFAEPIWTTTSEESGLGVDCKSKVVLCQPGFMIRSVADFIDAVIELVDLRYRPEVNTIGALVESDPSEHAPLAEPIWTTTPEESGLGFVAKPNLNS